MQWYVMVYFGKGLQQLVMTLPGKLHETLSAENNCFPGSMLASDLDPPFTCADKDLCTKQPTQPAPS